MYCFYVSYKQKKVFVTDFPPDRAKRQFGIDIELVNSVKDKENIEIIKARVMRSHSGFEFIEQMQKAKYVMTPEHKQALINSKLGKKRSEEVRRKIAQTKTGKVSNFAGKKHTYESKRLIAIPKYGHKYNQDLIWVHNPDTDEERKVKDRKEIPKGFSEGRDYYSVEPGLYEMNKKN